MSEYRDILDDVVREDAAEQQDTDFEEEEVREQETEQDDSSDTNTGHDDGGSLNDRVSNSVGRGAVENIIKQSVYQKYDIDAKAMKEFSRLSPTEMISDFKGSISELHTLRSDYELQREAVVSAIQHSTVVITGGPGSGKTTLLNTYIKAIGKLSKKLHREAPSVSLAAPTGMASKRMTASTGREARTIHKMFDIRYDLKINEEAKAFVSDIVVLDEVSMLDIDSLLIILPFRMKSVQNPRISVMKAVVGSL